MKCSFFKGYIFRFFSDKLAQIWAKILCTPKNLPETHTPMNATATQDSLSTGVGN